MPTYQYACTACGHQLEAVQSFADEPLTECPACEGRLRKLFSSVGVVFKGSGFYRTDSRADARAGAAGGKESTAKEPAAPTKESTAKDSSAKESSAKDSSAKDSGSAKGGSAKDGSGKSGDTGKKPTAAAA